MTYSIVARDARTGAIGVAVQSSAPFVGGVVPVAVAGLGAVVTQSMPNLQVKPLAIAMLREGASPDEIVLALQRDDPQIALRQFAVVDATGRAACFTGAGCIAAAGHAVGDGYSVQATMMRGPEVWPAMVVAFEAHRDGDLAEALLATLDAAEAAGGDLRGRRSAALLIVPAEGTEADRLVDIRVDDAREPLRELRRLHAMQRAMELDVDADSAIAAGDLPAAEALIDRALALAPEWTELRFWAGLTLLQAGIEERGVALLRDAVAADPAWRELLGRLDPRAVPEAVTAMELLRD